MNRNVESHFTQLPSVDIQRSIFDRSFGHKTSFNAGELIPFYWDEVLPGDTFNVSTSFVARLQTLLSPIMDNIYLDTYFFFVPNRIIWSHWKEFMGENSDSAWIPQIEYSMPLIESPEGGWDVGTIADYLGVPVDVDFNVANGLPISALPFRAYAMICNEWFRDQNLTDPLSISIGDVTQAGSNGSSYITDVANGGKPFLVSKYHDYFTSCLPNPQKGDPVSFDMTTQISNPDYLPVYTRNAIIPGNLYPLEQTLLFTKTDKTGLVTPGKYRDLYIGHSSNWADLPYDQFYNGNTENNILSSMNATNTAPANLWADSRGIEVSGVTSFTINELRLAFQLQKYYEKNARGGTRYRELLKMHFGVTSPDARMMIPEYLGGHRVPIQIHQITNSTEAVVDDEVTSRLGDVGAMSNTSDIHDDFVKSFTEHGIVMGVCCVRYDHSYPQGLDRAWTRKSSLDYYWPVFANIGEQPVYKYEIDATIRDDEDRLAVFGYQEAWASYRFKPNRVSGEMRPGISNTLAYWHLADYYTSQPALSDGWIREDKNIVDRALAVTSSVSNQIFCDFYVKNRAARPMPVYSLPGLIDHH